MAGDSSEYVAAEPIASWRIGVAVRALDFLRDPVDGVVLAVADTSGEIQFYDPHQGGQEVRRDGEPVRFTMPTYDFVALPRPSGWPDLAAVGGNSAIRIFDISGGELRTTVELPSRDELRVVDALSQPNGSTLVAAGGRDGVVHLWREGASELERLEGHVGQVLLLNALRVERCLAVADQEGITMWDLSGPSAERRWFQEGRSRALAVLRERGEVRVVSAGADGIHLWDAASGRRVAHIADDRNIVSLVALDAEPGEQTLAVATDRTVTLWSPTTEELPNTQLAKAPEGTLKALARILVRDGTLLAAGDERGNITVWRLRSRRSVANLVGIHEDWVNSLAAVRLANQQALVASASDDRSVRLWDLARAEPYRMPIQFQPPAQVLAVVPVGRDLAMGDQLGYLRRWSIEQDAIRWETHTSYGPVRAMASFHTDDGWRIVSAGGSGQCLILDARSGRVVRILSRPLGPRGMGKSLGQAATSVRAVTAVLVDDRWLVAAGDLAGRIDVWDAVSGEIWWELPDAHPNGQVRSLACVRTGTRVLLGSGSSTGALALWDLAERRQVEWTTAHEGPVSALCPLWNGSAWLLASGGADRALRLWDPEGISSPLSEVSGAHESWVRALVEVPTADTAGHKAAQLASGDEGGSVRLWQVRHRWLVLSNYGQRAADDRERPTNPNPVAWSRDPRRDASANQFDERRIVSHREYGVVHDEPSSSRRQGPVGLAAVVGLLAFLAAQALPNGLSGSTAYLIGFAAVVFAGALLTFMAQVADRWRRARTRELVDAVLIAGQRGAAGERTVGTEASLERLARLLSKYRTADRTPEREELVRILEEAIAASAVAAAEQEARRPGEVLIRDVDR